MLPKDLEYTKEELTYHRNLFKRWMKEHSIKTSLDPLVALNLVELHRFHGYTPRELGHILGLSRERIRQIIRSTGCKHKNRGSARIWDGTRFITLTQEKADQRIKKARRTMRREKYARRREAELYPFIEEFNQTFGRGPSLRELREEFGYDNISSFVTYYGWDLLKGSYAEVINLWFEACKVERTDGRNLKFTDDLYPVEL